MSSTMEPNQWLIDYLSELTEFEFEQIRLHQESPNVGRQFAPNQDREIRIARIETHRKQRLAELDSFSPSAIEESSSPELANHWRAVFEKLRKQVNRIHDEQVALVTDTMNKIFREKPQS